MKLPTVRAGAALERVVSTCLRHARLVLAVVAALAVIGLGLAFLIDFSGSTGKLIDSDNETAQATSDLHRDFGDEPITIRVHGKLTGMLLTRDLATMLGLEGCLGGNIPRRAKPIDPVCSELGRKKPMQVVYGPGTFVNEAAGRFLRELGLVQADQEREARRAAAAARAVARSQGLTKADQDNAARSARQLIYSKFQESGARLALKYGLTSIPALNNPDFVLQLVFAPRLGGDVPKPRFAYVFPDKDTALIQARLKPGLSNAERSEAIKLVRRAVRSDKFSLKYGRYSVSGVPLTEAAAAGRADGALVLSALVALLLLLVLTWLSRAGPRWFVPVALAAAAASIMLAITAVFGVDLTATSVAFAALVLALGTGLALRFTAWVADRPIEAGTAAAAIAALLPLGLATAAGSAALLLAPTPSLRDLGGLIVLGLLVVLAVIVCAGAGALWAEGRQTADRRRQAAGGRRQAAAGSRQAGGPVGAIASGWTRLRAISLRRPAVALCIGLLLAVLGWVGAAQLEPGRSIERQLPGGASEVKDAAALRADTGSAGEVSVLVRAADVTDPLVLRWMAQYQARVARRHGWRPGQPCQRADLCPTLSLTGLFNDRVPRTRREARALVRALPQGFSENVLAPDRSAASMAFSVRNMPVADQEKLFEDMRDQLDPPPTVEARLGGALVEQADSGGDLESARWWLIVAALIAVALVVLAACGTRGVVTLVPLALATGWAWLVPWVLGMPLDPLTAVFGVFAAAALAPVALVLARRRIGGEPAQELSLGRVERSANIAVALGFLALVTAGPSTLRDFGFGGAAGVLLGLAGMAILVPAALALSERSRSVRLPRSRAEALAALRVRPFRRAR